MAGTVLVVVEHDRGAISPAAIEALTAARRLGDAVEALTIGEAADPLAADLAAYGVTTVRQVHDPLLVDYGPEAWGEVVAQAVRALAPAACENNEPSRPCEHLRSCRTAGAVTKVPLPCLRTRSCLRTSSATAWRSVMRLT